MRLSIVSARLAALVLIALVATSCGSEATVDLSGNAKTFDGFAVLWLGSSYDLDKDGISEMPLRVARARQSAPFYGPNGDLIRPATSDFQVGYGDCELRKVDDERKSCRLPITLSFDAPCETPELSDHVKKDNIKVRGVDAVIETSGKLWIETGDVTISISPPGSDAEEVLENALTIANDLEGANEKAQHIKKSSDFTPKDASACSSATPGG